MSSTSFDGKNTLFADRAGAGAAGRVCAMAAMALAAIVLVGWSVDGAWVQGLSPGLATMKVNSAICLALAGLAGWLTLEGRGTKSLRAALGGVVLVVAAVSLSEDMLGWDAGIDNLLATDRTAGGETAHPGRMAPGTAAAFVYAGAALLADAAMRRGRMRTALVMAAAWFLFFVSGLALGGYLSEWLTGRRWWNYAGMAAHTALGFLLLAGALRAMATRHGRPRWALDRVSTIGFAAGTASMILAASVSHQYTENLKRETDMARAIQMSLTEIDSVRRAVERLEGGQRGYLITGEDTMLAGRAELVDRVRAKLALLAAAPDGDAEWRTALEQLDSLVARRTEFGERTIAARRERGFAEAAAMVAGGEGVRLSEEIETRTTALRAGEEARLAEWSERAEGTAKATFLMLPLGVLISLSILALGAHVLNASVGEREDAAERLGQSLKELGDIKAALDAHAIVAFTDHKGRITAVNDKFCAISGYSREELLGRDHRIVNSDEHPREFMRALWGTIRAGRMWHGEIRNRAKNGSFYWVDTTIVPFIGPDGAPERYVAIRADITERKLAEAARQTAERRIRAVIESMREGLLIADEEGRMLHWNEAFLRLHDLEPAALAGEGALRDLIGRFALRTLDGEALPLERWPISLLRRGETVEEMVLRVERTDIDWRRVFSYGGATTRENGDERVVFLTITDVTARVTAEDAVRRMNLELEGRVAERTRQLQEANRELEAFSYSVSHDLRAPLRAVDGFSQALAEDFGERLPEDGHRYLATIRSETQRMGTLIDDLLAFSRLSRAHLGRTTVDMVALARAVWDEIAGASPAGARAELRLGELPPCSGDPSLLRQVWVNLLSNALKYSARKERPLIEVAGERSDGETTYRVRDNGAGFDMRYADKLFGVFQRLHRAEDFAGTGVGLAIVQRIVNRHGGRVRAEGAVGRGACFYFTLPRETDLPS